MPWPSESCPSDSSHGRATTTGPASPPQQSPSQSDVPDTQFPSLPTSESHIDLSARASTCLDPHLSASFSTRVRAGTTSQSKKPSLQIHLPSSAVRVASVSRSPETLPILAESPPERPSAPIDIPARRKSEGQVSRPTTPLTARAPQGEYFASWHKAEPRISESLIPYYSSRAKKPSDIREPLAQQRGFAQMNESTRYRPSSPLSPNMSAPLPSISNTQKARMPVQSLNLAGLPKYHPANFPSRGPSPVPSTPLSSRSIISQPRSGRGSDAKLQLLQYQRDLITNTAKTSHSLLSSSVSSKPTPPQLNPLKSPGGPMTPFMLEGASDYLAAGSGFGSLQARSEGGDEREFVERLVRRENERRNFPEARSRSVSPALSLSPAVSPVGGRG